MQANQTKLRKRQPSHITAQAETKMIFDLQTKESLVHGIAIPTPQTFLTEWRQMAKDLKKHNVKINDIARQALCQVANEMKGFLKSRQD